MAAANTTKHMVYLKSQAKKAEGATVESPFTFFMVLNRATKDAILHVEKKQAPAKFKSPAVIQQRLKKAKSLDPTKYEDFFKSLKSLVSCAGTVTYDEGEQKLIFTQTVRSGKGSEGDLRKGLKAFRFIKAVVAEPQEQVDQQKADAAADEEQSALLTQAETLFGGKALSATELEAVFYDKLGTVDNLVEMAGAMREKLENSDDPRLRAQLEALEQLIEKIDTWDDEDGIVGVMGGLNELLSNAEQLNEAVLDLIDSTLTDVRNLWKDALTSVREVLKSQVPEIAQTAKALKAQEEQDGSAQGADQLNALASEEALVTELLKDIPEQVRGMLEDEADKVKYSVEVLGSLVPELSTTGGAMNANPIITLFDKHFSAGIGKTLSTALSQMAKSLANLQKQIA